jgi:hypothetical protein
MGPVELAAVTAGNNPAAWSPIPASDREAVESGFAALIGPQYEPQVQTIVDAVAVAHHSLSRATLAGYVEIGEWLTRLWSRTDTGCWLRLFRDSYHPIERPLPFSRQQAEAFMRIAHDAALANPKNWDKLPDSWRIADEILRAVKKLNAPVQALIDDGRIHRAITRAEIQAFAPVSKKRVRPTPDVTLDTMEQAAATYLAAGKDPRALIRWCRGLADRVEDQLRKAADATNRDA